MPHVTGPHDSVFDDILEKENGTNGFLESVFSYLQRKTNFYAPKMTEEGSVNANQTEEHLVDLFLKYKTAQNEGEDREGMKEKPVLVKGGKCTSLSKTSHGSEKGRGNVAHDVNEVDVKERFHRIKSDIYDYITQERHGGKANSPKIESVEKVCDVDHKNANCMDTKAPEPIHREKNENGARENGHGRKATSENVKENSATGCDNLEPHDEKESAESRKQTGSKDNAADQKKNEADDKLKKDQMKCQKNPDTYNGSKCGNYAWSQAITEVDVRVTVPDHVTSGRQCHVTIGKKRLSVSVEAVSGVGLQNLVDGELSQEVRYMEAMWSLVRTIDEDGKEIRQLHISMEKLKDHWWTELLVGGPTINLNYIECSRPFDDVDEEARAKIRKMVFDQKQKQLGKPTSDEMQIQEMLKKSCNQNNSPFKEGNIEMSKMNICH